MAEFLFRSKLDDDSSWVVQSAGVAAAIGYPASKAGIIAMRDKGIDMSSHKSQPLTQSLVDAATLIVTMTAGHRRAIVEQFPATENKVYTLGALSGEEGFGSVPDPIGQALEVYVETRNTIEAGLAGVLNRLSDLETN